MIRLDRLTFSYAQQQAVPTLNAISLQIEKGRTCAIIGRSGSGKTTLLHLMAGFLTAGSGTLLIDGAPLKKVRPKTSVVLQNGSLFPWKTVEGNLLLALDHKDPARYNKMNSLLEELEITAHGNKFPSELSGGERQRVAIARALITEPDLLIMDEPTAALDAITKEIIQGVILKLHKHHGMTLVLVTHDIEEAVFLGQQLVVLREGCITANYDNAHFGRPDNRSTLEFYKGCIALREVLDHEKSL